MEDSPAQVSVNPSPEQEKISDINIQANPGAEPYAFLGLPEGSELEDIKNKVRKLRGRFHPDRVTSDEEKVKTGSILADINVAYKTILAALDVSFSNRGGINKEAIEINEAIEVERFRVRVEEGIKIKLAILENSLNSIEDLTLMSTEYFLATFNIGADMYFKKTGVNLLYPYFTEVLNFYRRAIDMVFSEEFIKKRNIWVAISRLEAIIVNDISEGLKGVTAEDGNFKVNLLLKLKEKIKEEFTVFIKTKSNTMRTSGTVDQEVKEYQDAVIEDVRKHLQIDVTLD